ncbi:MAG: hypothetical protein RLZZ612_2361 [Pseudomonadota bacterium]|jgi:hypothetical protein
MCPNNPPTQVHSDEADEEYLMPSPEAMLAGTLALMTGYAQQQDDGIKGVMAKKVVSNLFFLIQHPYLSEAFRQMLTQLRERWQHSLVLAEPSPAVARTPSVPESLWHTAPVGMQ